MIAGLAVLVGALSPVGGGSRSVATELDAHGPGVAPQSGAQQEMWGDVDCSGSVNPIDSLKLLRKDAGLSSLSAQGLCPGLGSGVAVNAVERVWGDGDCSGALNPVDSLKTLRYDAGLSAPKVDPTCPGFGELVTLGDAGGLLLLNEVLFNPGAGDDPFVELKATGDGADPSGLLLVNERGDESVVPNVGEIAGDAVLLLTFGGSDFLDDESGFVELRNGDEVLDRVAWGEEFADGVNLSNGGVMSAPLPEGSSIGRPPGANRPGDRLEWTVYYDEPTPGSPNANPEIAVLSPRDGARMATSDVLVTWNAVVGASGYAVRVAPSSDLDAPVLEVTVDSPRVTIGALADGEYTWSVQPIGEAGDPAPASEPRTFAVGEWPFGATPASGPGAEALLDVELIQRRKDTSMLLLEADFSYEVAEHGDHFWDSPHGNAEIGGHPGDPADNMNSVEASVAMINAYLGGFVSQDRLGYEVFKDRSPGPERDLSYGDSKSLETIQQMAEFAFSGFVQLCSEDDMEAQWEFVKGAIDEDLPLIAFSSGSPLPSPDEPPIIGGRPPGDIDVIFGYHVSDPGPGVEPARFFAINAARYTEAYAVEFGPDYFAPFQCFWKPSVAIGFLEEASLALDSDGDEINDFDETERFHTNPNDADTDGDGVSDKEEVYQSLFGPPLTIDLGPETRDWDKDGVPMELDCDSDNDGIKDGADDDDFSVPEIPEEADCGTPDAYIGSTHMFQTGGGRMNVAVAQDILFVRDPDDPLRYEAVSGTLTYSVSEPYFPDCQMSGSTTVPIEAGDADFDFITGLGLPSLMVGTGNTPGLLVPATVTCPDQSTFEVMASIQIWFWPQEDYTNLNHLAGEFTPSFGDGYTTYTWDFYGTEPP